MKWSAVVLWNHPCSPAFSRSFSELSFYSEAWDRPPGCVLLITSRSDVTYNQPPRTGNKATVEGIFLGHFVSNVCHLLSEAPEGPMSAHVISRVRDLINSHGKAPGENAISNCK